MDPENKEVKEVPVYSELAKQTEPELEADDLHSLALAYAKYLADNKLAPGDATFVEPEEVLAAHAAGEQLEEQSAEPAEEPTEEPVTAAAEEPSLVAEAPAPAETAAEARKEEDAPEKKPAARKKSLFMPDFSRPEISDEEAAALAKALKKSENSYRLFTAPIDGYDKVRDVIGDGLTTAGKEFIKGGHKIVSTYRNSRRVIGAALLFIGVLAAALLIVLDKYTVYEYAYNGKVLGYVKNQEDVVEVLDIAGGQMTKNNLQSQGFDASDDESSPSAEVNFVAGQNVTFKEVDGRGKSIDNADIAVNKLVYMTDIETEAFGIYDGDNLTAVVKSNEDAELLLHQTQSELSKPDSGMELVSSEFTNDLAIKPVNVLLTSVQSYERARKMMTEGGKMEIYHIVEEGETLDGIAAAFGVEPTSIFDETNSQIVTEVERGDKICVHEIVDPVSVKMVETGKMKEVIPYETIKKESDLYYKGDTHIEQEGIDRVQIFEGTITKVSGEVVDRDQKSLDVRVEGQDKIILVGTAERPKTAPTGTFVVPLHSYEGISSPFGYRWGRLHSGIDMGAHHGTPIYAADGGTVIMAGWYYGYGLCVDIDHGNGRVTRYGHCSALLVNKGDKVYQGQNIALVGNTGHSYGNHLHFEIRINGTPVNPRPYLGI